MTAQASVGWIKKLAVTSTLDELQAIAMTQDLWHTVHMVSAYDKSLSTTPTVEDRQADSAGATNSTVDQSLAD